MVTNDEIKILFQELIKAYNMAVSYALDETKARTELENIEASMIASGVITGSNAETRNANMKIATAEQREALDNIRLDKMTVDAAVKLTQIAIDSLKWQIRNEDNMLRRMEIDRVADMDE